FYQVRHLGLERAPSTRELLNWLKYINTFSKDKGLEKLVKMDGMGVLIKTQADMKILERNKAQLKL
ncbi:MAG: hypothetical protein AAGJ18_07695, partial [Bacteroidota bacterium]